MKMALNIYMFLLVVTLLEIALAFIAGWVNQKITRSKAAKVILTVSYFLGSGYLAVCWVYAMFTVFLYAVPSFIIAAVAYPFVKKTAFVKEAMQKSDGQYFHIGVKCSLAGILFLAPLGITFLVLQIISSL